MTQNEALAELLFPNITKTAEDYERIYPPRALPEGARVTRIAPSPTGYLHIGVLFGATVDRLAAGDNGVFYFRLEDTDKKREVAGGADDILEGLNSFGLQIDEGYTAPGVERGVYGPYAQSRRAEIYQCFARQLVAQGLAYPCFCTEAQRAKTREKQEAAKLRTGYYGVFAPCRDLTAEQAAAKARAGEPHVVRLRSPGDETRRIRFDDQIKGVIEMPENDEDFVLLKSDGIPTYHFAHAVDDHLMRTTHVIRGDEWIASTPKHLQLFSLLGWRSPKYCHHATIMIEDAATGGKRKLSKRKDPEAAVTYFIRQGYPPEAISEYLMTVVSSDFEQWRRANPQEPRVAFPFSFKKMSVSGALFDPQKLTDVSKDVISVMSAEDVYTQTVEWAKKYDTELLKILEADPAYARAALTIDRNPVKPRKDIAKWSDVRGYISYFYDELYVPGFELPQNITRSDALEILKEYIKIYDEKQNKDEWFEAVKNMCGPPGYTPNVKEYKQNPGAFKGHIGDVTGVIRLAVTGRQNTPDLHAIMALLGRDRCVGRMEDQIRALGSRE